MSDPITRTFEPYRPRHRRDAAGATEVRSLASSSGRGTGVAPLLLWLAVVCGLAGVTVLRIDEPSSVIPIWFGAIVGLAVGQAVAALRLRVWAVLAASTALWMCLPLALGMLGLFGMLEILFGNDMSMGTALTALLPAVVCGYASLTERGALLAFWYPTMLWMLVILDAPTPGPGTLASIAPDAMALRSSVGLVVGLGVLFLAFVRAHATRRVALWSAYSRERLATPVARTVLRASPVRTLSQTAWTGLVGAGALGLAAWIAPELWQKERAQHEQTLIVHPITFKGDLPYPCCYEPPRMRERVREYFPLVHGQDLGAWKGAHPCSSCSTLSSSDALDGSGWTLPTVGNGPGIDTIDTIDPMPPKVTTAQAAPSSAAASAAPVAKPTSAAPSAAPIAKPTSAAPSATPIAKPTSAAPSAAPIAKPTSAAPSATPIAKPTSAAPSVAPMAKPTSAGPSAAPIAKPTPALPAGTPIAPSVAETPGTSFWPWLVAIVLTAMVLPLAVRAVRRALTLHHLSRPFWVEPIGQRISNHWQRMLIGLRDAGIQAKPTEQPRAFARRIGFEGMAGCAAILERVRHGVRVDEADVRSMGEASAAVYRTSRKRAGALARFAASFRWPLV